MDECPPPPPPPPPAPLAAHLGLHGVAGDETEGNRYQRRNRPVDAPKELKLLGLHECDKSMEERVMELLAEKWPKKDEARREQLRASREEMPVSLVLLEGGGGGGMLLVGHAMLLVTVEDPMALLAESVVVAQQFRGMGYGGTLMRLMHDYARRKGYRRIYLATKDKRDFYLHLGYVPAHHSVSAKSAANQKLNVEALAQLRDVLGGGSSQTGQLVWLVITL